MSEAEAEKKHLVRIHIDRQTFESPNPTTGAALYELGDVGPHKKLFREVEGNHDDEFIPREDEQVHLKEDDHFYSQKATTIFVNGTPEAWPHRKISYEQAVKLAFLRGQSRFTLGTPEHYAHIPEVVSFDAAGENDIYRNIQVADFNMLNAAMAVMKWKKLCGFYADDMREHHSLYTVATHGLTKEDKA
ncbi:hypothetical protein ACVOMS_35795 (plasmid) [Bradyrhizobium guangxiense]|uniref:hypothetical protein n=1 Tax=Bradyrhizobium guangxiense TaxID=1325115 RepID=UPI0037044874